MDLSLTQTLVLCGFVFIGGFVDSIAGGGGLITLPAYFAMGLPAHAALATNKFSSVCGTSFAVLRYWRAGTVSARVGLPAAAGALFGSAIGAKIALVVPASVINTVMLVLVPAVLVFLLLKDRLFAPPSASAAAQHGWVSLQPSALRLWSLLIGLVIGAYDGFFGPGTGTFLAIAFSAFLGLDLLAASGNARVANLASNLGSVVVFLASAKVLFPLALYTAAAGICGNLLGSRLAVQKGARVIKPLMVVVLLLLMAEVVRRRYW
ncbi:MAG: TSUP family transporter [Deltaproteobacteria bacterium]|nr:TSUP family transporter [Deltaproteobacteria bacterium]